MINTKQRFNKITDIKGYKSKYSKYSFDGSIDSETVTYYTIESDRDDHEACNKILEKFAQSIKDNNNTNDHKNGSLGDAGVIP